MPVIPYQEALNLFLSILLSLPVPIFTVMVWSLGLTGIWTVLHILLEQT